MLSYQAPYRLDHVEGLVTLNSGLQDNQVVRGAALALPLNLILDKIECLFKRYRFVKVPNVVWQQRFYVDHGEKVIADQEYLALFYIDKRSVRSARIGKIHPL